MRAVQYCELLTNLSSAAGDVSPVGLMRGDLDEDEPVDERTYQHCLARWERGQAVLRAGYKLRNTAAYGGSQGIPEPAGALSPLVITSGWQRGRLVYQGLYLSRQTCAARNTCPHDWAVIGAGVVQGERRRLALLVTRGSLVQRGGQAGVGRAALDDALAALKADLRAISGEECPSWGEFADEVARIVGLHERRQERP